MKASQASGTPCDKPDWTCISEKTVTVPSPAEGQVLIEMKGSSVNPVNVDLVEPACLNLPPPLGCSSGTIGNDGAGTIVAVGSGCSDFSVGDDVWGFPVGTYAQYALANCKNIGLKPKKLSFVEAGTIPVVGGTSLQCLRAAGMPTRRKNFTVVITSGQGGTGYIGIQLAKALGASRVVTAATGPGIDFVKSLGADVVVDYKKQELSDVLPDDSVDIVFDNFGAKGTADKIMHAIRSGGTFLVLMGGNGGAISKKPKEGVHQVSFGLATAAKKEMDDLKALFEADKIKPKVMQPVFGLSEVAKAFTRLRSSGVLGKIAVAPDKMDSSMLTMV